MAPVKRRQPVLVHARPPAHPDFQPSRCSGAQVSMNIPLRHSDATRRSGTSIDIGAVVDAVHPDGRHMVVDVVEESVGAPSCAVLAGQFTPKRFANAPGSAGQVSEGELDDCGEDPRWELVEVAARGGCESCRVAVCGIHFSAIAAESGRRRESRPHRRCGRG